jgi:hypothetical protein
MRLTGASAWDALEGDGVEGEAGGHRLGRGGGRRRGCGEGEWQEIDGEDDAIPPLPIPMTAAERDKQYEAAVEEERKRLGQRVKGDKDGWASSADVANERAGVEGDAEGRGALNRRASGAGVVFMPFVSGDDGARASDGGGGGEGAGSGVGDRHRRPHTAFLLPSTLRHIATGSAQSNSHTNGGRGDSARLHSVSHHNLKADTRIPDPPNAHALVPAKRPHTTIIPTCTSTDPMLGSSRDIAALARSVGGRGLMAPPQCVDASVIDSATRRVTSHIHVTSR